MKSKLLRMVVYAGLILSASIGTQAKANNTSETLRDDIITINECQANYAFFSSYINMTGAVAEMHDMIRFANTMYKLGSQSESEFKRGESILNEIKKIIPMRQIPEEKGFIGAGLIHYKVSFETIQKNSFNMTSSGRDGAKAALNLFSNITKQCKANYDILYKRWIGEPI